MVDISADIVFDYRQKVTRSFAYLQGDYYVAPAFLVHISFGWFFRFCSQKITNQLEFLIPFFFFFGFLHVDRIKSVSYSLQPVF